MATNNFTVFGTNADSSTIYNTGTGSRTSLFTSGLRKNTSAKAEDVLTPLRETSLVTVAILDWVKDEATKDFDTPDNNSITNFIENVKNALTSKINTFISNKQDKITPGTGFLTMKNNNWTWDEATYQTTNDKLSQLININTTGLVTYNNSSNSYEITTNKYMYLDEASSDVNNGIIYLKY